MKKGHELVKEWIEDIGEHRFQTIEDMDVKIYTDTDNYAKHRPVYYHVMVDNPLSSRVDIFPQTAHVHMRWDDGKFCANVSHSTRDTSIEGINFLLRTTQLDIEKEIIYKSLGIEA